MVGSQVVNLLFKNTGPEIFADKLHDIKFIFETRCVFGKPVIRNYVCSNLKCMYFYCYLKGLLYVIVKLLILKTTKL